ncbi:MAG: hypothetical protein E7558_01665 [Ruminococcaceae bacterium]|nr:hypothetical protein [Oscillospiraceae bacterium]
MRIIIDTDKGIFIVPKTFRATLKKQNDVLKKAGVSEDKFITERKFIEEAIEEAFKRPILSTEQAKDWNPDLEHQIANK